MIKKSVALFLLLVSSAAAFSQEAEPGKRPDIPGNFALDFGFNRLLDEPNDLEYGFWGSRTANIYYQYHIRIGQSKFSFHPGIGLGMERFKLQGFKDFLPSDTIQRNVPTLIYDGEGNTILAEAVRVIYDGDSLGQPDWSNSYTTKKSMLVLNYLDIPVEFRFSVNPDDPARSFKVALGGRIGYLIGAKTKLKYEENGNTKKLKNEQRFNLNPFRYSAYTRIYLGNFSLFGYYNFSPMFKEGKGPMQTNTTSYTVGISLSGL